MGHPTIFALGDCAAVPSSNGEGFYAPTAQNAIREGPVAAAQHRRLVHKVSATEAFDYKPMGSLASLGQRKAVAQIGRLQLSGLPAWFAWRGIYLAKLPTLADRMLVLLDWIDRLGCPSRYCPGTSGTEGVAIRRQETGRDVNPSTRAAYCTGRTAGYGRARAVLICVVGVFRIRCRLYLVAQRQGVPNHGLRY